MIHYLRQDSSGDSSGEASEAPRPQAGASRERNIGQIVPLDPAYKAGLAGHLPVNKRMQQAINGLIFFKVCDNDFWYIWELERFPGVKI